MEKDVVIKVENLGKKYTIGEKQPYLSIRDTFTNLIKTPINIISKKKKEEFWALKGVSFEVKRGEVIGVIGKNGAGKSTLLKILSRITEPTTGRVELRGRVASMLEVGTGFHPELTGRENIYLNGSILGMSGKEIKKKFDKIVEFSGVEKFLDTPVKYYSSGMYVRLAFAVAAHLEPEILVVDEVLSVGDAEFQKKCLGKMDEVSKTEGRTILFVSHNMSAVQNLCSKCILLEEGKIKQIGDTNEVIQNYLELNLKQNQIPLHERNQRIGKGNTKFIEISLNSGELVRSGEDLNIKIKYTSKNTTTLKNSRLGISFKNIEDQFLFFCATEVAFDKSLELKPNGEVVCNINKLPLTEGEYSVGLFLEVDGVIQDWVENAIVFEVNGGKFFGGLHEYPVGYRGKSVLVKHNWEII
jgi:lipopolysaccharide transport system ATP-binding protein